MPPMRPIHERLQAEHALIQALERKRAAGQRIGPGALDIERFILDRHCREVLEVPPILPDSGGTAEPNHQAAREQLKEALVWALEKILRHSEAQG